MDIVRKAFAITGEDFEDLITIKTGDTNLNELLTIFINWLLYLSGILAFIFLVYSGILYITSGGNPDQAKKAQQGIINAIIGIVVITFSYLIIRAVTNTLEGI